MKDVNIKLLVGIAIVAMIGVSVLASAGLFSSASKYTTFDKAKVSGETVHIVGSWVKRDQAEYIAEQDLFKFYMQDSLNNVSLVHFYNPMPQNFKTAKKLVVEGKYDGDVFVAEEILMKCPSKYNDQVMEETASAAAAD